MATLSNSDKTNLNADQQAQIAEYKKQWAAANAAGDQAGMDAAHQAAEAIRNSEGYTGGSSGNSYKKVAANAGGQTADEVRKWVEDYEATNWDPERGWVNGGSVSMNSRSKANYIRQQMEANSEAWHTASEADKEYLHQQNEELAKVLVDHTGISEKSQRYDPSTGKWYTWNRDIGYGSDDNWSQPNIADAYRMFGITEADRENFDKDTSHYYDFTSASAFGKKFYDRSSGFNGEYSQFANGLFPALMHWGTLNVNPGQYTDAMQDGFGLGENGVGGDIQYDENGNVIPIQSIIRDNSGLDDYTRQFAAYTQNGVIQPNALSVNKYSTDPRAGDRNGAYSGVDPTTRDIYASMFSGAADNADRAPAGSYEVQPYSFHDANTKALSITQDAISNNYIDRMYDALLESQLEQLKTSYEQNVSDLDSSADKVDTSYAEQKRQTDGQAAQNAANWREMAAAYGLNSGAIGQAALAMNNQTQSDLNTLNTAQAAALAEIERQRVLLAQEYQSQINQAKANNDYERANALYQEAVRQEELLLQQQQQLSDMISSYAMNAATAAVQPETEQDTQRYINPGGGEPTPEPEPEPMVDIEASKKALSALRNIVSSSPTYNADQKTNLAMEYYTRGYINDDDVKQFLKENGIEI